MVPVSNFTCLENSEGKTRIPVIENGIITCFICFATNNGERIGRRCSSLVLNAGSHRCTDIGESDYGLAPAAILQVSRIIMAKYQVGIAYTIYLYENILCICLVPLLLVVNRLP